MPEGEETIHLKSPMPEGEETIHLKSPMPEGEETIHLKSPMAEGEETIHLKSPMPEGEETIHYLETVNVNNKFNIMNTSGYIATINFIFGVLLLRLLAKRSNV